METFYIAGMFLAGLFFGWTIGSHYTGAVMGTAFGAKLITPGRATVLIALCALLGATFASHNVVKTVGTGVIAAKDMTPFGAMIMMLTAALVTAANTWLRLPVSTSQLAIFSVVGAALAMKVQIIWYPTIVALAITWVATPISGLIWGFVLTKIVKRFLEKGTDRVKKAAGYLLILVCCYAAFTLGANNTGNAVGVFYGTGAIKSQMVAGFIGGIVVGIGALTWGRPLLEKVGLHIVQLDLNSAIGAQLAQAITAHTAAYLGYPTSMNQAIVGGIAGAGLARGIQYVRGKAIAEIVVSWVLTPIVAATVAFCLYSLLAWLLGVG